MAEVAVWYSIAVIASLFVMLFVFATLSQYPSIQPSIWLPSGVLVWLFLFGVATWRIARSATVQQAEIHMGPIYAFQAILVFLTVIRLPFESAAERGMIGGLLLVWETWIVVFSLGFLFLAACARRKVPARTWVTTAVSTLLVGFSIYQLL